MKSWKATRESLKLCEKGKIVQAASGIHAETSKREYKLIWCLFFEKLKRKTCGNPFSSFGVVKMMDTLWIIFIGIFIFGSCSSKWKENFSCIFKNKWKKYLKEKLFNLLFDENLRTEESSMNYERKSRTNYSKSSSNSCASRQ